MESIPKQDVDEFLLDLLLTIQWGPNPAFSRSVTVVKKKIVAFREGLGEMTSDRMVLATNTELLREVLKNQQEKHIAKS